MKKLRTRNINKRIETWSLGDDLPVKLEANLENDKIQSIRLIIKKGKKIHNTYPLFVKPEFFDLIKERSPWSEYNAYHEYVGYGWENAEIDLLKIYSGEISVTKEDLVFPYHDGHIIFDADGTPIPIVTSYDYIGTPFSNRYCDLEPMLEHLKSHPWVLGGDDLVIQEIPYYNNSGGEYFIGSESSGLIHILPTEDAYREIYEGLKGEEFFSIRMKEAIHSGAPHTWQRPKKDRLKDYLGIHQFFNPREDEDE